MAIPRLHKEASIFDEQNPISGGIDDAAKCATDYITEISGDGIWVTPEDAKPGSDGQATGATTGWHISGALEYFKAGASWFKLWLNTALNKMQLRLGLESSGHVVLDDSGMDVLIDTSTSVASFGSTARVGTASGARTVTTSTGVDVYNSSNQKKASFGADQYVYGGNGTYPYMKASSDGVRLYKDASNHADMTSAGLDVVQGGASVASFGQTVRIGKQSSGNYAIVDSDSFDVYHGNEQLAHIGYGSGKAQDGSTADDSYYTFGKRLTSSTVGNLSFVEGEDCKATDWTSHAEGFRTSATNAATHAEGYYSTASGNVGHVEGYYSTASGDYSHAEGQHSEARGSSSHAEGLYTLASGDHSHAQGARTIAASPNQTAIGCSNIADYNDKYALIIGNGSDDTRSNAMTVDWSGNVNQYEPDQSFRIGKQAPTSANVYVDSLNGYDANGDQIFYSQSVLTPAGDTYRSFVMRRASADGETAYTNGFYLHLDSAGAPSVTFTSGGAKAWRDGIGAAASNHVHAASAITNLGDYLNFDLGTTSVATAKWKELRASTSTARVKLPAGVWVVMVSVSFATNATGRRMALFTTDSDSENASINRSAIASFSVPAATGEQTKNTVTTVVYPSAETTYYVHAYQNSGSAVNTGAYVRAVRIR